MLKAIIKFLDKWFPEYMTEKEEAECENVMKRWNIVKSMRMQNIITLEEYEQMCQDLLAELDGIEEKYS